MSLLVNMFVYLQHACAQMLLHCVDKWKKTVLGLFLLCFLSGGYFFLFGESDLTVVMFTWFGMGAGYNKDSEHVV